MNGNEDAGTRHGTIIIIIIIMGHDHHESITTTIMSWEDYDLSFLTQ